MSHRGGGGWHRSKTSSTIEEYWIHLPHQYHFRHQVFRAHSSFSDNFPHPSSHVENEVRQTGNVVSPKFVKKMARLVARRPKNNLGQSCFSVNPAYLVPSIDGLNTCGSAGVGAGNCHTTLFQREKMLGFFKIEYPVALMSVSCFDEFAETVLVCDMHSRQLLFRLFKKLKRASLANVFQEVDKSLNEGHVPSYL